MSVCWVNFDAIVGFCCQLAFCFKYKRKVDLVTNVFNGMQAVKQSQKAKFLPVVSLVFCSYWGYNKGSKVQILPVKGNCNESSLA